MTTPTDYFTIVWIITIISLDLAIAGVAIQLYRRASRRNKRRDSKRNTG